MRICNLGSGSDGNLTYIETEKLYMTSYEMEVLINGEQ